MGGEDFFALGIAALAGGVLGSAAYWYFYGRKQASFVARRDPDPVLCLTENEIGLNPAAQKVFQRGETPALEDISDLCRIDSGQSLADWVKALDPKSTDTELRETATIDGVSYYATAFRNGPEILVRLQNRSVETDLWAQVKLRIEERDRFRSILDGVPLPVWWRRPEDLKVAGANLSYRLSVGLTKDDDIERSGRDLLAGLVPGDGTGLAKRALTRAAQQSESHHIVIDGDRRLYDFVELRLNDDGWTVGYGEDRTDLEAMQASVGESIAANDAVLEQLLTAIAVFGPDRRLKFYNTAYAELWGLEEKFLNSDPLFEEIINLLHDRRQMPESVDVRADIRNRQNLFTSLVETREELLHLPDERSIRLSIVPHPMGGLLFQFEDVTDKLALERSFNTLTEVQQATLNNLYEGIAVFSRDGRMRLHNRAYSEIWQLSDEDMRGSPHIGQILDKIRHLMPDTGDWDQFRRQNIVAVTEPRVDVGRFELTDRRIIDYAEVPLPDGQCLLMYLDVTDSVRVQRVLEERNAALENADLLKSRFISNMSYELRTPLNTIVGFSEILQNGVAGPLSDKQQDYVLNVLEASRQLTRMVSDILDLATIQAGFMRLDLQDGDVGAIVNDAIGIIQATAADKSVSLVLETSKGDLSASCDPERIHQVLINLLTNAIKFTPEGGRVSVKTELPEQHKGFVSVIIEDTGTGIAEDDREKVFESFVRASSGTRQTGVGLGLALSKSFIELHGGRIEISPASSGGTQVTCLIPKVGKPTLGKRLAV